jgi:hypothetical protein
MVTISPEARDHARKNGGDLYLEYIVIQGGCCIPYQPGPAVRHGRPHDPARFHTATVEGITIFVPHELPDVPLKITVNSFMGFKWLIVEGWRHA